MPRPVQPGRRWLNALGWRENAALCACALVACNEQQWQPEDGAAPQLEQIQYFALVSDLPFDTVRVFRWRGAQQAALLNAEAVNAQVDADRVMLGFVDSAGRNVEGVLEQGPEPTRFSGAFERCAKQRCESGRWRLWPLASAAARAGADSERTDSERADSERAGGFAAPAGYDLVAELSEGEAPSDSANVVVAQGVAYVALGRGGVRIIDVSEPQRPRELTRLLPSEFNEIWNDVKIVAERWLLVASSERGLKIFDVQDAANPLLVQEGFPGTRSNVHNINVQGERLYLSRVGNAGGLSVLDFSEKPALRLEAEVALVGCREVHEASAVGTQLFANCLDDGFRTYDVSDVSAPRLVASFPQVGSHSNAVVKGTQRVVTSSEGFGLPLEVLKVEEQGATLLGRLANGFASSPHNLYCQGSQCWVAHHQEGVIEFNVDEPEAPQVVAQFSTWRGPGQSFLEGATGVFVDLPWVYIADNVRGLLILRRWE